MEKIDFVLPWVNGSDPEWRKTKDSFYAMESQCQPIATDIVGDDANSDCRYRELGFLRYLFRSIELYAPWVNKIYFITCGQSPDWLNREHPKLVCINHKEYIPNQYLPTFNSNTIELNVHRIKNLSERFVLFNDDMFLLQPVSPDFFFHGNDPILVSSLRYPKSLGPNNWSRVAFNNYCLVNRSFDNKKTIWKNRNKWFNMSALGFTESFRNILCYWANKSIPVGNYGHLAEPHLKSTFSEVWANCYDYMDLTCRHKFRSDDQVNQWLLCAWNQAQGKFYPGHISKRGNRIRISPSNMNRICDSILGHAYPQLCLNDTSVNTDSVDCADRIISAFNQIFPNRSSFEID